MSDNQQIAVVQPPRLAPPANLEERYGVDPDQWGVLVDATFPGAKTTQGVLMALAYCKQRSLDPFRKCVHIVPIDVTDSQGNKRTIETVWPGIGELRVTAQRQGDFAGWDACEFGPMIEFRGEASVQKWKAGKPNGWEKVQWLGPVPEWAQFTVFKMIHGQRIALPGPKVYFMETYSPVSRYNPSPNERWTRAPRQMLEKCAEAAALRRAWPDVFGDEASFEEMEGRHLRADHNGGEPFTAEEQADNRAAAGARPTRADFKAKPAGGEAKREEVVEDGHFEEVDENAAANGEQGQSTPESAENGASDADENLKRGDDKAGETLPSTRGQWEAWVDGFRDNLDARDTVDQIDRLVSANEHRLEAAPEDIQETLSKEVSAKRAQLSNGAGDASGGDAGDTSKPEE